MAELKEKKVKTIKADPNTRYRVSVFRSNKAITAQLIDDATSATLASATSANIKEKKTPIEKAALTGEAFAEKAKAIGAKIVVFDRNGYKYHGRVKSLAEGIRKGGLEF